MKCLKCLSENPAARKFCRTCGEKLVAACPGCGYNNLSSDSFCGGCGQTLTGSESGEGAEPSTEGERKQVTVLFSDLSGYTSMTERLDPEEVKEIITRILGGISQLADRYEGRIEKFIGDAVVVLFGVPKAHEDDAIRAIRAAVEIHRFVEGMSPEFEDRIGQSLTMHTAINTGIVVTGQVTRQNSTQGVTGDTINLAARLTDLARPGEILTGATTYRQALNYFNFEKCGPTRVKGKTDPVEVYRILSPKGRPVTLHRLSGLRADLIGRTAEMGQLREAVEGLRERKGAIFSICGDAGTGKSRLVEEFKTTVDLDEIEWHEGHAYSFSQNIPYFPLIDLLNRAFQIEEGDPPESVRRKVELGIRYLIGKNQSITPFVGSLYTLSYPEIEHVSPEFWKTRLQDSVRAIFSALTHRRPTVICLEDLHWADPSSLELLRFLLSEFSYPALFLCVYRPPFSLLLSHQMSGIGKNYQELRLPDLSSSESQDMMESLLKTKNIPIELRRFVTEKIEGNPFYLEEVINSLVESETLTPDNGGWRLTKPLASSSIPSSVHGVISARLDRLDGKTKRILQEASVIGKAFPYEILRQVTDLKDDVDRSLGHVERLDLIRARSPYPDLEYVFRHALTQEVVYDGLLRRERQTIHERIGLAIEEGYPDRLPEFHETLAFHFKQGNSLEKALDYLTKSGEKAWRRHALDASHQYFREAFQILSTQPDRSKEAQRPLIDLLIKWAAVFNHRGDYKGLAGLFETYVDTATFLDDKERLGMFYGWFGFARWARGETKRGYQSLREALRLGEESENVKVIAYACAWLAWACGDLGLIEQGIAFGKRARDLSIRLPSDQILFRFSMGGMGLAHYMAGDRMQVNEIGNALLDYGQRQSDVRSTGFGYLFQGVGHIISGGFAQAVECLDQAIRTSVDPIFSNSARFLLGMSYISTGQMEEAERTLEEVIRYSECFGTEFLGTLSHGVLSIVSIAKGDFSEGIRIMEETSRLFLKNENLYRYATTQYFLGRVNAQIAQRSEQKRPPISAKNLKFFLTRVPFAGRRAEDHFHKAIETAKGIGAKGVLGQAYLDLGRLNKGKGKKERARQYVSAAIRVFEQSEAEHYLKQAQQIMASLG
jgi:class 3 adenylate cyclase/tetratricopeptide (TPR) repeat protein